MKASSRYYWIRIIFSCITMAILSLVGVKSYQVQAQQAEVNTVNGLVDDLWIAEFDYLPELVDRLEKYPGKWESAVSEEIQSPGTSEEGLLRGRVALARRDSINAESVFPSLLELESGRTGDCFR